MKRKLCLLLAVLCTLLCLTGCGGSQRERDWKTDIEYLRKEYKKMHLDPFYYCSEEEFDWKLDQLAKKVGELSDADVYFELAAIVAGMQDNHTSMVQSESIFYVYQEAFPFYMRYFGDRPYLYAYKEGYEQLEPYRLREVVAVNGVNMDYLRRKAECLLPQTWWCKEIFTRLIFFPAFLDWAGCGYKEGYTFQILNENNEVESVDIPAIPKTEWDNLTWVYPEYKEAVPFLNTGNYSKYVEGEESYVYLSFSELRATVEAAPWKQFFQEARDLMDAHPDCSKLVIDLRGHSGGDASTMVHLTSNVSILDAPTIENTYVLTCGMTASAAIGCLSMFKEELDATIVGEPTAQFTDFFGFSFAKDLVLPKSKLPVLVANYWNDGTAIREEVYDENGRLYPWENTILPDVYVHQDIEDIRQGKDSVIEWVLAQ